MNVLIQHSIDLTIINNPTLSLNPNTTIYNILKQYLKSQNKPSSYITNLESNIISSNFNLPEMFVEFEIRNLEIPGIREYVAISIVE